MTRLGFGSDERSNPCTGDRLRRFHRKPSGALSRAAGLRGDRGLQVGGHVRRPEYRRHQASGSVRAVRLGPLAAAMRCRDPSCRDRPQIRGRRSTGSTIRRPRRSAAPPLVAAPNIWFSFHPSPHSRARFSTSELFEDDPPKPNNAYADPSSLPSGRYARPAFPLRSCVRW
jgi:hypothetical protein